MQTDLAKALARTYDHPSVADPWEIVQQYRAAMRFGPDTGAGPVARKLEVPRGRVRPWLDGGMPDAVRGIQVAHGHGWLPDEGGDIPTALRQVATWNLAAGSIDAQTYRPYFVLSTPDLENRLRDLLQTLDVDLRTERRDVGRSVEGTPDQDASVLGRVLAVLGVPTGKDITGLRSVPAVLTDAPNDAQRACAATYLRCRGQAWDWEDQWVITHRGAPTAYLTALADWFTKVTGTKCTATDDSVQLPGAAVDDLLEP